MKVWTYHPEEFRIDDPTAALDSTKGQYWNYRVDDPEFRYRHALAQLREHLNAPHFLWCCTTRDNTFRAHNHVADAKRTEWEIEIPLPDVLAFLRVSEWEKVLKTGVIDWEVLLIQVLSESQANSKDIDALVRFPLLAGQVTCLGRVPTYDEVQEQKQRDREARFARQRRIQQGQRP